MSKWKICSTCDGEGGWFENLTNPNTWEPCSNCNGEGGWNIKPKRIITPHKGGRTVNKRTDVTPEVNKMLAFLWQHHNISLGDIVAEAVKVKYQSVTSHNNIRSLLNMIHCIKEIESYVNKNSA